MLAERANKLIEDLAGAFGGQVTLRMGPISPYPEMTFYHARHQAFVDLVTREGVERLTLTLPLAPAPNMRQFDLRLFLPRRFDDLLSFLGLLDPRKKELDQPGAFRLHTPDASKLARYFREGSAYHLREIASLPSSGELAVAWTPGRFMLQKPVGYFDINSLKHIVTMSLRLLENLTDDGVLPFGRGAAVEGEAILRADGVVWDPILGACRVCGDGFSGPGGRSEVVYCGACSTPHHRDCWQYTGTCSVYACGGKQLARVPAR